MENCGLCRKYPCAWFKMMNVVVRLRRLDRKLPHTKTRKPNMGFIRKNGLDAFLSQQEHAWSCPHCAAHLSWYLERCPSCGKDINPCR